MDIEYFIGKLLSTERYEKHLLQQVGIPYLVHMEKGCKGQASPHIFGSGKHSLGYSLGQLHTRVCNLWTYIIISWIIMDFKKNI